MSSPPGLPAGAGRLALEGLSAGYRGVTAVRLVSVAIEPGERVALIGTNGSGKTTLLRCILGLHRGWVDGVASVAGEVASTPRDWTVRRRTVAWLPQRPGAGGFPVTVAELLESSGDRRAAAAVARELGLGGLEGRPVDRLSGGQLQRVYLARAFGAVAAGAGILLADEPTSALDFDGRDEMVERLSSLPVTQLVATHDARVVQRCDRVLEMAGGSIREAAG